MEKSNECIMLAILCKIGEKVVLLNKPDTLDNFSSFLFSIGVLAFLCGAVYHDFKKK